MTPELASSSPNYHNTPKGGRLSSQRRVLSGTGLELVTRPSTIRYLDHSATAATNTETMFAGADLGERLLATLRLARSESGYRRLRQRSRASMVIESPTQMFAQGLSE
ncbi:hypothetical protein TNCV_516581 [Trichonephila clavipes]|nr:hypothetical protein TNCV_516581 [Trichonephila clavipes]